MLAALAATLLAGSPVIAFQSYDDQSLHVMRWNGDGWDELPAPGDGVEPSIAIDPAGNPLVAYIAGYSLVAQQWTGKAWRTLDGAGGEATGNYGASEPSLAFDGQGRAVLAWQHASLDQGMCCRIEIRVRRFDDGKWRDLHFPSDGAGATTGGQANPVLGFDGSNSPFIAWEDERNGGISGGGVVVSRYDGQRWTPWTKSGLAPATNVGVGATVARDGSPFVVWSQWPDVGVLAAHFTGKKWQGVGTPSGTKGAPGGSCRPVATTDAKDRLLVAWCDGAPPGRVRVQRFEDGWADLGRLDGHSDGVALAADGDGLFVAWSDDRVHIARWNGEKWTEYGNPGKGLGRCSPPALAVGPPK